MSRQVVKLKPTDKDAQAKFRECEKVVKAIRFAKAISQPDEDDSNIAESIDLSSMGAKRLHDAASRSLTSALRAQPWTRRTRARGWVTTTA